MKKHTQDFKREAVRIALRSGLSRRRVASQRSWVPIPARAASERAVARGHESAGPYPGAV